MGFQTTAAKDSAQNGAGRRSGLRGEVAGAELGADADDIVFKIGLLDVEPHAVGKHDLVEFQVLDVCTGHHLTGRTEIGVGKLGGAGIVERVDRGRPGFLPGRFHGRAAVLERLVDRNIHLRRGRGPDRAECRLDVFQCQLILIGLQPFCLPGRMIECGFAQPALPDRVGKLGGPAGARTIDRVAHAGAQIGHLLIELALAEAVLHGPAHFLLDNRQAFAPALRRGDREHACAVREIKIVRVGQVRLHQRRQTGIDLRLQAALDDAIAELAQGGLDPGLRTVRTRRARHDHVIGDQGEHVRIVEIAKARRIGRGHGSDIEGCGRVGRCLPGGKALHHADIKTGQLDLEPVADHRLDGISIKIAGDHQQRALGHIEILVIFDKRLARRIVDDLQRADRAALGDNRVGIEKAVIAHQEALDRGVTEAHLAADDAALLTIWSSTDGRSSW